MLIELHRCSWWTPTKRRMFVSLTFWCLCPNTQSASVLSSFKYSASLNFSSLSLLCGYFIITKWWSIVFVCEKNVCAPSLRQWHSTFCEWLRLLTKSHVFTTSVYSHLGTHTWYRIHQLLVAIHVLPFSSVLPLHAECIGCLMCKQPSLIFSEWCVLHHLRPFRNNCVWSIFSTWRGSTKM